jgi:hypothetical protein
VVGAAVRTDDVFDGAVGNVGCRLARDYRAIAVIACVDEDFRIIVVDED